MSDQRSTTPSDSPPPFSTADGAPSAENATDSTPARPPETPAGPLDPNASQEGPSRRSFTVSMPFRPPGGRHGDSGGNGPGPGPGDFITWTFEVLPGPPPGQPGDDRLQPNQPGNTHPTPEAAPRIGPFGLAGARPPDRPNMAFPPGMDLVFGSLDHREILRGIMPLFASGLSSERRPDPAKAAELIRALPTVDKAMMDRVDRVVIAADNDDDGETGWKCSICLEGAEVTPADGSAAIKATPCHHLFHSGCLEPWFQTKTSCPMCREPLDSLGTQADNESRASVRPPPSQTPTPSTHPYARPSATRSPPRASPLAVPEDNAASDSVAAPRPEAPTAHVEPGAVPDTPANSNSGGQAPTQGGSPPDAAGSSTNAAGTESAAVPPVNAGAAAPQSDTIPRRLPTPPFSTGPRPELGPPLFRMPFMAVINIGPNGPEPPRQFTPPNAPNPGLGLTDGPIRTSPMPMDRLSSPVPGPLPGRSVVPHRPESGVGVHADPPRPGQAPDPSGDAGPHHHHHHHHHHLHHLHHHHHHHTHDPGHTAPQAQGTQTPAGGQGLGPNDHQDGQRQSPFPFTFLPPPSTAPDAQPPQPSRPGMPRPSLASYILSKERDLGLTCAAASCKFAHESESIQEDKEELLSIHAADTGTPMSKFACAHKWHRACLEASDSGLEAGGDADGRMWTTCGLCGAKGWVTGRDDARSEGEVERLVHA